MISVVGIGNAASKVVSKFSEIPQYDVYVLNSEVEKNSKYKYKLNQLENPEECEQNIPEPFLGCCKNMHDRAFFVVLQYFQMRQ